MIDEIIQTINSIAWIGSNVLIGYIALALVLFVAAYYALFDPSATSAGKVVFRFMVSLVGVIGLIFISLFVNPASGREWYEYPGDVVFWRPLLRFAVYAYVAWTITGLGVVLAYRKWRPWKLKTAEDQQAIKIRDKK